MNRINRIRMLLEFGVTIVLLAIFPFNIERKLKLFMLYAFCQFITGRYQNRTLLFVDELKLMILSYGGFLFTAILTVAFRSSTAWQEIGFIILFTFIDFICSLIINRYAHIWFRPKVKQNTLIIGAGNTARQLDHVIATNRFSNMDVKAFVNANNDPFVPSVNQTLVEQSKPVIPLSELELAIAQNEIENVLIAIPEMEQKDLQNLSKRVSEQVDNVRYLPYADGAVTFASVVQDFDGLLMISTSQRKMTTPSRFIKRTIDILGGLAGCMILLPLTAYVYVLNRKNGDTDPIFFSQNRIGKDGKEFKVYKFRTMVPNAEQILEQMMKDDPAIAEEYRINKKLQHDPRITQAGEFLRKTSLDEFPQFYNVLKGDMSIVGPRPYLPREVDDMHEYYKDIVSMKPGVTGMWQTHGRSAVDFEKRLMLDGFYYRNWSLWLDMTLLLKTIKSVFSGDQNAV